MIIGLGHRSRHGKDTVGNFMIAWAAKQRPDLKIKKLSWAWKLKDVAFQLYGHLGLREAEFYDTPEGAKLRNVELSRIGKTPVEIWIDMGTPAVREHVWDQTWIAWVEAFATKYDVIICPDTRFANEVSACDVTIKVTNPRVPHRTGKSVDNVLAGWEGWDYTVVNDGDLRQLETKAHTLAHTLLRGLPAGRARR
jgi:hypothetical protein